MTDRKSTPDRTGKEPRTRLTAKDFETLAECLRLWLKRAFPRLDSHQIDDWVQHLTFIILDQGVPTNLAGRDLLRHLWTILKRDVLDSLKRREMASLEALTDTSPGGGSAPEVNAWSPSSLAVESERLQRRERLLSDVLRDFVLDCEKRQAWIERELMERLLRGQNREEAARAMNISMEHLYQTSGQGRKHLQELMQKQDVHRSVFVSFFGQPREKRPLPDGAVPAHQAELTGLIRFLIEEAGAMCPSDSHLEAFAREGKSAREADPVAFRDVWYHVNEARCPLCATTLAAIRSETT